MFLKYLCMNKCVIEIDLKINLFVFPSNHNQCFHFEMLLKNQDMIILMITSCNQNDES